MITAQMYLLRLAMQDIARAENANVVANAGLEGLVFRVKIVYE